MMKPLEHLREVWARVRYERDAVTGLGNVDPISIPGRAPVVVAIHGYCGVPYEVEVVCDAARTVGLAAEAPLMAGHGTSAADLAHKTFTDWVASVRRVVEVARERGPVILAGLSLGSLVALELAREFPEDVRALCLMANALWLRHPFPALALDVAERLGVPDFAMPKFVVGITDEVARNDHTTYLGQPVHAAMEVQRAGRRLQGELPHVAVPTLVLHGARDQLCPVSNAWRAAAALGTNDSRVVILPRSGHIITRDVERARVQVELEEFFRRHG